jgi:transcription initiation factor TFIIF subunit beta
MKGEDVAGPSGVGSEDVKMEGMDEVDEDDDDDDDDDMEEVS